MSMTQKQRPSLPEQFIEENTFEVSRATDGDVMITFLGRVKLPETTFGVIEGDTLTILETCGPIGIKFMGLNSKTKEWIAKAGTVYIVRVFKETPYVSELQVAMEEQE